MEDLGPVIVSIHVQSMPLLKDYDDQDIRETTLEKFTSDSQKPGDSGSSADSDALIQSAADDEVQNPDLTEVEVCNHHPISLSLSTYSLWCIYLYVISVLVT